MLQSITVQRERIEVFVCVLVPCKFMSKQTKAIFVSRLIQKKVHWLRSENVQADCAQKVTHYQSVNQKHDQFSFSWCLGSDALDDHCNCLKSHQCISACSATNVKTSIFSRDCLQTSRFAHRTKERGEEWHGMFGNKQIKKATNSHRIAWVVLSLKTFKKSLVWRCLWNRWWKNCRIVRNARAFCPWMFHAWWKLENGC